MNHVFRSVLSHPAAIFSSPPSQLHQRAAGVRLSQVTTLSNKPDGQKNMDKTKKPNEETGDVMSHSFGEGYATRSDQEGFGGIYGGNQSIPKVDIDKEIHENHPAYDKTHGSEVKEKEKARFQKNAGC